jgi:hypothetical protein
MADRRAAIARFEASGDAVLLVDGLATLQAGLSNVGDVEGAELVSTRRLSLAQQHGLTGAYASALMDSGNLAGRRGRVDEQRDKLERAWELCLDAAFGNAVLVAINLAALHAVGDAPDDAERWVERAEELCRSMGRLPLLCLTSLVRALIHASRGELDAAARRLAETEAGCRRFSFWDGALTELATVLARRTASSAPALSAHATALAAWRPAEP